MCMLCLKEAGMNTASLHNSKRNHKNSLLSIRNIIVNKCLIRYAFSTSEISSASIGVLFVFLDIKQNLQDFIKEYKETIAGYNDKILLWIIEFPQINEQKYCYKHDVDFYRCNLMKDISCAVKAFYDLEICTYMSKYYADVSGKYNWNIISIGNSANIISEIVISSQISNVTYYNKQTHLNPSEHVSGGRIEVHIQLCGGFLWKIPKVCVFLEPSCASIP